jgi:hypothetical protein
VDHHLSVWVRHQFEDTQRQLTAWGTTATRDRGAPMFFGCAGIEEDNFFAALLAGV